jgi:hypothetical protein
MFVRLLVRRRADARWLFTVPMWSSRRPAISLSEKPSARRRDDLELARREELDVAGVHRPTAASTAASGAAVSAAWRRSLPFDRPWRWGGLRGSNP